MLQRQYVMKKKQAKAEPQVKKNHTLPSLSEQRSAWAEACDRVNWTKSDWTRRAFDAAIDGRLKVRFTEARIIRGQIKGNEERDEVAGQWQFRATEEEVARWGKAAEAQGLVRAEWCRQVLDAAASKASQSFLLG
jgi:hypothetical protein